MKEEAKVIKIGEHLREIRKKKKSYNFRKLLEIINSIDDRVGNRQHSDFLLKMIKVKDYLGKEGIILDSIITIIEI